MVDYEELSFAVEEEEEEGIDPERIVNDDQQIAKEFFCAICQGLLWKPRSCASCQHLFCTKCIRTWLKINPTICPFRCSPYEEKRAPPYIHSLLSRLTLHCRNSSFGCTEILSYDQLEQHQTTDCQFPTKQCRICQKYILLSLLDQHQTSFIPTSIECFLCKCLIESVSWQQHLTECFKRKLILIVDEVLPPNNLFLFQQEHDNDNWIIQLNNRLQQFLSVLPRVDLIGYDTVMETRQQSLWLRTWSIFQLIFSNKWQAAQIIILLLCFGIGCIAGILMNFSLQLVEQVEISLYRSVAIIIMFSGLISFSFLSLLNSVSDLSIIIYFTIGLILCSSIFSELPIEYFRIHISNISIIILYTILFFLLKLFLLLMRFYFCFVPPYISAGGLAWVIIFCTFHIRDYY